MNQQTTSLQVAAIQDKLAETDGHIAGKYLEEIANKQGDASVIALLDEMTPGAITQIIRKFDYSCPSIIPDLITAEKALEIIKEEPAFWKGEYVATDLDELQRNASDLLSQLILTQESVERKINFIKKITKDSDGLAFFIIALAGEDTEFLNQSDNYFDQLFDEKENMLLEKGSPDELLKLVKDETPEVFDVIKKMSNSEGWRLKIRNFANHLKNTAIDSKIEVREDIDDMFTTID